MCFHVWVMETCWVPCLDHHGVGGRHHDWVIALQYPSPTSLITGLLSFSWEHSYSAEVCIPCSLAARCGHMKSSGSKKGKEWWVLLLDLDDNTSTNMPWRRPCIHLEVLGCLRCHVSLWGGECRVCLAVWHQQEASCESDTDFRAKLFSVHFIIKQGIWENIQGFFPESLGQNLA